MVKYNNAYDLLRLILAALVIVSHAYLLGDFGNEPLLIFSKQQITLGDVGVMGFFSLSGYLISASYNRSPNIALFIQNRLLRVFPGFWVCLIVVAFIIAPAIFYVGNETLTGFQYWGGNSAFSFVYKNMLLPIKQWSIPGVLDKAAYQESLNGSTWSLFPEMLCYMAVLGLGILGLFAQNKTLLILFFGFVYSVYVINLVSPVHYGPTILTLSNAFKVYVTFLCGAMLYSYGQHLQVDKKGYIFLVLLSVVTLKFGGFLIIAPVVIALFCVKLFATFQLTLKYDISYGLYIYAFPVQHLIFVTIGHRVGLVGYILLSLTFTALLAYLSFRFIEKPFLKLKRLSFNRKEGNV